MKNLRNEKGITLVALVVTIIVLLILAGVSLSLVAGGNGIIDKAVTATDETNKGAAIEQAELVLADKVADYYAKKYVNGTASETNARAYLDTNFGAAVTIGNYKIEYDSTAHTIKVSVKDATTPLASGTVTESGKVDTWE